MAALQPGQKVEIRLRDGTEISGIVVHADETGVAVAGGTGNGGLRLVTADIDDVIVLIHGEGPE